MSKGGTSMNIVVVNCPDCGKELEIDCNFKKSIC